MVPLSFLVLDALAAAGVSVQMLELPVEQDVATWRVSPASAQDAARAVFLRFDRAQAERTEAARQTRQERNRRLTVSDWTQVEDAPSAAKAAWRSYRQALRDLPTTTDLTNPVWPMPPA